MIKIKINIKLYDKTIVQAKIILKYISNLKYMYIVIIVIFYINTLILMLRT